MPPGYLKDKENEARLIPVLWEKRRRMRPVLSPFYEEKGENEARLISVL